MRLRAQGPHAHCRDDEPPNDRAGAVGTNQDPRLQRLLRSMRSVVLSDPHFPQGGGRIELGGDEGVAGAVRRAAGYGGLSQAVVEDEPGHHVPDGSAAIDGRETTRQLAAARRANPQQLYRFETVAGGEEIEVLQRPHDPGADSISAGLIPRKHLAIEEANPGGRSGSEEGAGEGGAGRPCAGNNHVPRRLSCRHGAP